MSAVTAIDESPNVAFDRYEVGATPTVGNTSAVPSGDDIEGGDEGVQSVNAGVHDFIGTPK